jgi:hypothetical protein
MGEGINMKNCGLCNHKGICRILDRHYFREAMIRAVLRENLNKEKENKVLSLFEAAYFWFIYKEIAEECQHYQEGES